MASNFSEIRAYLGNKIAGEVKGPMGQATGEIDPAPGLAVLQHQNPPPRGTSDLLKIYTKNPKMRSVMNKIAVNVASVDWQIYIPRRNGKNASNKMLQGMEWEGRSQRIDDLLASNQIKELPNHPILDVLSQGNDELVGFTNSQVIQTHIDLVGEAFWLKERNAAGVPVELWPVPPHWVMDLPTKGNPYYKISATGYRSSSVDIPVTEVIHFRDPDPYNPYGRGSGVGKSLGDDVELDEYATKYLRSFFFNRARPDIIVSGQGLSRENTRRLEEAWLQKHQGFWQRFKPLFLSRQVDVKVISQSLEQIQMVELRRHEREVFFNTLGVSPELFGQLSASNRSTIDAASFFFAKFVILPRMEFLRTHLQKRLIPEFDDRLILHFRTPVQADLEFQLSVMKAAGWAFDMDEWRKKAGVPEMGGKEGKLHFVPTNTGQLLDVADNPNPQPPAPANPPAPSAQNMLEFEDELERQLLEKLPTIVEQVKARLPARI